MSTDMQSKIDEAVRLLRDEGALKIILFGSQARGTATAASDIDLLVVREEILDLQQELMKLNQALWKVGIYPDIVLVDRSYFEKWSETTNHICNEAKLEGKVLYEAAA